MELLEKTVLEIAPPDADAMRAAEKRIDNLTMPRRALGTICELGIQLAGITGLVPPPTDRRTIVVMAGDHGIVDEGVTLQGREVTWQMVANMTAGGAGVNVLGRMNGAQVVVADFGMMDRDERLIASGKLLDKNVGKGTANMAKGPAMNREQAILAVERGIETALEFADDTDLFGTGEMGIGNTSPATAIASVLTKLPVSMLCGSGAGIDHDTLQHKINVIGAAIELNRPNPDDILDVLSKVGGYEIAGIAGLILGAAARRKPILVDGFISSAGAMVAQALCVGVKSYMILSHASAEPGHVIMCEWLGARPLLDLGMRLGEGTGAAMAFNVVEAAARIMSEMATFDSSGVTANEVFMDNSRT